MVTDAEAQELRRRMELVRADFESANESELTQAGLFLHVLDSKIAEGREIVKVHRKAMPVAIIARLARLQHARKQVLRVKLKGAKV